MSKDVIFAEEQLVLVSKILFRHCEKDALPDETIPLPFAQEIRTQRPVVVR